MAASYHIRTNSARETIEAAKEWAAGITTGAIIALQGDLGAGKTHFTKGVAEALGWDPNRVQSPTFALINEYAGTMPIYHFDCYRMETAREAIEIGMEEYLYGDGVSIIEWPERVEELLPPETIWVRLETTSPTRRVITITD